MNSPKIRCIITDDEPFAAKGLEGYVAKIPFLELVARCEDALQLNAVLKQQSVDLLFLDIEMPHVSGIAFLKGLPNPPKVIFTTAYDQYAIEGYELDVLDYLLKPISFDRFLKSANKAYDYFNSQQKNEAISYCFIKVDQKLEKVFFNEIQMVEALGNYVAVYTGGRKLLTHVTLKNMQENLPASMFIQPHKSFLVNMQFITAIEGNTLHIGALQAPVSKYSKDEILEKIVNNTLIRRQQ